MRVALLPAAVGLVLTATAWSSVAVAQTGGAYSLVWNNVASGVQASATGAYQLRGSLGQPDAGLSGAGAYQLHGGFWTPSSHGTVAIDEPREVVPRSFHALPSRPNPFHTHTTLGFDLPGARRVSVVVFDLNGRRVRSLADFERAAGRHHITWDGRDEHGTPVPAGIYFARIVAGPASAWVRTVRLK